MEKIYNLAVPTGEYISGNDRKTSWETIGAVYKNDKGGYFMTLKAHFNPAAIERPEKNDSIIINMFSPKK